MKQPRLRSFFSALLFTLLAAAASPVCAQQSAQFGDLGNGSFRNPVLPSDFSDPDFIRIGDDYYGITSTFCFSPGMLIFHSRDLVHWELTGHVVDDITQLNPDLGGARMNGYYHGIWAGSLRYHDGTFYCHFATPKGGWFVARTDDIRGRWQVEAMRDCNGEELRGAGWDDVCPLWDDDGQAYIVASNFGRNWYPHLFRMSPDGTQLLDGRIVEGSDRTQNLEIEGGHVIKEFRTAEAAKLYKWNGLYYIYFSEVRTIHGNRVRVPVMRRSESLYGPYDEQLLMHSQGRDADKEPNQGAILETPAGEWYFLTHHGSGDFDGRVISVVPVRWEEGWPLIGIDTDDDGIGEMVWELPMPAGSTPEAAELQLQTSDDFETDTLAPQWEWNHQPFDDRWSLTERPGWLRMYAFGQLRPGEFFSTRNMLSQRYIRWGCGEATVTLDLRGMADGQRAGLAHFNGGKDYAAVEIRRDSGRCSLWFVRRNREEAQPFEQKIGPVPEDASQLDLRAAIRFDGTATFAWSSDGSLFTPCGEAFQIRWGNYRGDRIGLYTFNNETEAGWIDIDRFDYRERKNVDGAAKIRYDSTEQRIVCNDLKPTQR